MQSFIMDFEIPLDCAFISLDICLYHCYRAFPYSIKPAFTVNTPPRDYWLSSAVFIKRRLISSDIKTLKRFTFKPLEWAEQQPVNKNKCRVGKYFYMFFVFLSSWTSYLLNSERDMRVPSCCADECVSEWSAAWTKTFKTPTKNWKHLCLMFSFL